MHFGFEYGGRFIWYKPTFDMQYEKHSPGEVLIRIPCSSTRSTAACESSTSRSVKKLSKCRFANHTRYNYAVRTYQRWLPYRLNRLLLDARAAVEKRPALAGSARKLLWRWRDGPWL